MKQTKLKRAFFATLGIWLAAVTLFGITISFSKPSYKEVTERDEAPYNGESRVENIPLIYRIVSSVSVIRNSPEEYSASEMYTNYIGLVLTDSEYLINKAEVDAISAELQNRTDGIEARFSALNYVKRRIVTEYYAEKWNIVPSEDDIPELISKGCSEEEAEYLLTEQKVIKRLFFFSSKTKSDYEDFFSAERRNFGIISSNENERDISSEEESSTKHTSEEIKTLYNEILKDFCRRPSFDTAEIKEDRVILRVSALTRGIYEKTLSKKYGDMVSVLPPRGNHESFQQFDENGNIVGVGSSGFVFEIWLAASAVSLVCILFVFGTISVAKKIFKK